jgi:hypothetical protein
MKIVQHDPYYERFSGTTIQRWPSTLQVVNDDNINSMYLSLKFIIWEEGI